MRARNPSELEQVERVMRYRRCAVHLLEPVYPEKLVGRPKDEAVPWLVEETRARMQRAAGYPSTIV